VTRLISVKEDEPQVSGPSDSATIRAGERVEITVGSDPDDGSTPVWVWGSAVSGGSDLTGRVPGVEKRVGTATPPVSVMHYTPDSAGELVVSTRWQVERVQVAPSDGSGGRQNEWGLAPDEEQSLDDRRETQVDPSEYTDIVNADTPSGIAWAPDEVRSGRTADPDGTEVVLSDGRTATVYPRQDSDEAIRDTETGAPIDSPVGSGGVEGGVGDTDGSLLGGAVAVVVALLVGAAALLGGGE